MARSRDRDIFLKRLADREGRASNGALQRELNWTEERYSRVRGYLLDEGLIEKGRGYGGSVLLVQQEPPEEKKPPKPRSKSTVEVAEVIATAEAEIAARELDLYPDVLRQLDKHWSEERKLDASHCEITALQGRRETGGSWSRPDLSLIGYKKYEFLPEKVFELYSFEVKPSNDVSIKGVLEALAHREAATRSFVIYYTAGRDFHDYPEATRIEELAARHGVGVYAAKDVSDFGTWAEIVPAQRAAPDPEAVDTFIRRTFSDAAKTKLRKWF